MRHRIGIVLALGMLAAVFFGGAWGYVRLLRLPAPGTQLTGLPAGGGQLLSDSKAVTALVAVAATGLLAGVLIAVPRISPLAAGLPGLVFLGWEVLYLVNVHQAVDLIPLRSDRFGAGYEAMLFNGTLAAAGIAMIIPMAIPSRWRRPASNADAVSDGVFGGLSGSASGPAPDTFPIRSAAADTEPVAAAPSAPVIQPSAVFSGPATRMERVATGPSSAAAGTGTESPWQTAARAAASQSADGGW